MVTSLVTSWSPQTCSAYICKQIQSLKCICAIPTKPCCSTDSDDEYSDDDDMSWKVRRSSVKCLEAVISTRRDLLVELYGSACPSLVARFKEREESVRSDIFSAFVALLRQTKSPYGATLDIEAKEDPAVTLLKKQV